MFRVVSKLLISLSLVLTGVLVHPASAADLPSPTSPVVLTVFGEIAHTNMDDEAHFDLPMLQAIGAEKIRTDTPWDEGVVTYEGVTLSALMAALGANPEIIVVQALDGYEAEIPAEDFSRFGVILAWSRDGELMPVRGKGPLRIMYPFDSDGILGTEKYSARAVWQVDRVIVK